MTLVGFVGLAKAIDTCHDIWDAFASERVNAPARIRALVTTIGHLHGILTFLDENYQDQYPLKNQFLETLGECEAFIDNYRTLNTTHPSPRDNPLADTLRHPWDTTLYGLDGAERRAEELSQKLISQQQNLTIFLLTQFLKITRSNYEGASLMTSTPSETSSEYSGNGTSFTIFNHKTPLEIFNQNDLSHEQKLGKFHECFQLLRNRYERVTSNAAQHGRVPDLTLLHEEYRALWFFLCNHVGLPKNKQPAMPPMDKLFVNPSGISSDIRINSDRAIPIARTWSSPILTDDSTETSLSALQLRSSSTLRTTPQSTSIPHPGPAPSISSAESIILPGPAMFPEEHVASTSLIRGSETFQVRLGHWTVQNDGTQKTITWYGIEPVGELRHTIPPGIYPVSLHCSQNQPLHMRFLNDKIHNVVWVDENGFHHPQQRTPKYDFTTRERYESFQGDVRDKKLLKTYHTNTIFSNRQPNKPGEALLVVLKIWQEERPGEKEYSITYLRTRERKYADFPLSLFARPASLDSSKNTVRLEARSYAGSTRRKSSFFRKERPKLGSVDSDFSLDDPLLGVKWLLIQFSGRADAEDFAKVFNAMQPISSNTNSPNLIPMFRTPSMQSIESSRSSHTRRRVSSTPIVSPSLLPEERSPSRLSESPSPRIRPQPDTR